MVAPTFRLDLVEWLSGNCEPTSAAEFTEVIELIGRVRREAGLPEAVKTVLITNGSLLHRSEVQQGLRAMARLNGEVWFKLDRASEAGMKLISDTATSMDKVRENLIVSIALCQTWRGLPSSRRRCVFPSCPRRACIPLRYASKSLACRSR